MADSAGHVRVGAFSNGAHLLWLLSDYSKMLVLLTAPRKEIRKACWFEEKTF